MNGRDLLAQARLFLSRPGVFPVTQAVFLRVLGLVYLAAFASLRPQMAGLFGSHGIVPIAELLNNAHNQLGSQAYTLIPSIFWLGAPDKWIGGVCLLGSAAAILMLTGFFSRIASLVCWVLYLSIVSTGAPFTNFQWDALLLESGFLALFAGAPWLVWAYRVLLFRLIFESGLVKLTSGDPNWHNLHALRFHFLTQPLPTPLAWYAYHLPGKLLDALTAATLFAELVVPFFLLGPRRLRHIATIVLMLLQLAIILTGNYGFFNLLTLALCLWGFDDRTFAPLEPYLRIRQFNQPALSAVVNLGLAALMMLGLTQVLQMSSIIHSTPFRPVERMLSPFEIVNTYGLFAVMTTSRSEIVLQGSNDGEHWRDYEFPYKPGELHRGLPFVAPYMPRLDWQMWFAALGSFYGNRWVGAVMYRLLVGDPAVTHLLLPPPFEKPPKYMRAELYDYTFTSQAERARTGAVWSRKLLGDWYGPVSLTGR